MSMIDLLPHRPEAPYAVVSAIAALDYFFSNVDNSADSKWRTLREHLQSLGLAGDRPLSIGETRFNSHHQHLKDQAALREAITLAMAEGAIHPDHPATDRLCAALDKVMPK